MTGDRMECLVHATLVVPHAFANTSRRGGAHLDASWRDMASPPRATTLSFCNCLISYSDMFPEVPVLLCSASPCWRQGSDLLATCPHVTRGCSSGTQVAIKSPNKDQMYAGRQQRPQIVPNSVRFIFSVTEGEQGAMRRYATLWAASGAGSKEHVGDGQWA